MGLYQKKINVKRAAMFVALGVVFGSLIKDKYSPRVLWDKQLKAELLNNI